MTIALENISRLTSLKEIRYPLFKLGNAKPTTVDGVVFYSNTTENDDGDLSSTIKIVDDTNVPGDSLARRRLYIKNHFPEVKLYRIGIALFFLGDLIKAASPKTWFIDSDGKLLNYSKSTVVPLLIRRINKLINISSGMGVLIEVDGIPGRYKSLYPPKPTEKYAGMLKLGQGYIFYGYYDAKYEDSRRKI